MRKADSLEELAMTASGRTQSIAVIGAGIVGVSCALHLQRIGHRVEILDPRGPGEGASSGNAGIVALSEAIPFSTPATLSRIPAMLCDPNSPLWIRWSYLPQITPWFLRFALACRPEQVRMTVDALSGLLSQSWDCWSDLVRGRETERLLSRAGWLRVFETDAAVARQMTVVRLQRDKGVDVRELDAAGIAAMEPALAPIFVKGLYYPQNGLISNPLDMTRGLAGDFLAAGGLHRREQALAVAEARDRRIELRTESGARLYDLVVIAAGAWSRSLLRTLGIDLPLDTERGYHAMLPRPKRSLHRSVHFPESGFSLTPIGEDIRVTSGVEFAGLEAPPDFRRIRHMAARAPRLLPGLANMCISEWMGFRPSLPDSLPVIGRLRGYPAIIAAFGHGHLGLTTGPATGQIVAAIVEHRPPRLDISPFSPCRWGA
jgi:D-amino-acid dehydrogenase